MEDIKFNCVCCNKNFEKSKYNAKAQIYRGQKAFCSKECLTKFKTKKQNVTCQTCQKNFTKQLCEIKNTKNNFCSKSCAAKYNNTHRIGGTRRSKLEKWIEDQLTSLYPNLEIHFNRKDAINAELDIYIPSLKLAFELNGIFHYEPIYGKDKLDKIQNNDNRKFQACAESNISLCVIDVSTQKYIKPKSSQKFLDIIVNIINKLQSL